MTTINTLAALSAASILALYNGALDDFGAPEGFASVKRFANKAKGIEAVEALCAAGNLAVNFDGDAATIVDATPLEGDDDDTGGDDTVVTHGDGKGKVRPWGFALGSKEWLAANPRHTADREAYRTARRKAARMNRKAERAAKEAAHSAE